MEARDYNYYYNSNTREIPLTHKKKNAGQKNKKIRSNVLNNIESNKKENFVKTNHKYIIKQKKNWVKETLIVFFGLINLSLIILTLYTYITMNNLNIEISTINKEIIELEKIRDEYKVEILDFNSLEEIEEIAKFKLGMIYPGEDQE